MTDDKYDPSSINENLAKQIRQEWSFKTKRFPENFMERLGIVNLSLIILETLLITSNHFHPLGYWKAFVHDSSSYRDDFNKAVFDRTDGLVVPSLVGVSAYVITAVIYLRHELYQWKPELLQHYGLIVSDPGLVWYLINDMFYFYPHWIAHTSPQAEKRLRIPQPLYTLLHKTFKQSHRLRHRCKANIGIAAWYCSVAFNLFPALLSPVATQTLARAAGVERAWGTHLVTLYVWIVTAAATSVMAHTGYRSVWNDPGKHDLHHERAFSPRAACNFSTMGAFDWLHGTANGLSATETGEWRGQRDRQAALYEAERRSGVPLTEEQKSVVQQPAPDQEWVRKDV
ncbi:hypothetical protein KJ359_004308 [Pestalotiopsis sp. 9143b]|nr:hypothetical protein KJ359_004308 [Pestalotiopsis sp. 9143b]